MAISFCPVLVFTNILFLNSTEANVFFETQEYKQNIILESLSEMNYKSRVKRDFFDREEEVESSGTGEKKTIKKVRINANEREESAKSETSSIIQKSGLKFMSDKNNADFFSSLEYLGIIQVGESIGNNQSRETYPKDLVQATNQLLKRS
ncbi:uncharacterized protein BX663DRAFT_586994 [Cokeromyces recurvatus]|uniref:uncharacterized protein n=1 Tax=Cokeromyces recurvatus TaxID=90255 RepID=UPI00221FA84F|nr:uncharacterized protein BX663DRAFT_586994 [Cokeromyces recurvatus]KAI7904173.1 hypothetical protein BX663DRAFT_586994 [Cokeromyces recurvatus]